jgi:hypothetical protein
LLDEEETLGPLLTLAGEEQDALVRSDFDAVDAISSRMTTVAAELEALELRREQLMESAGQSGCSFEELAEFADNHGVDGFDDARMRLGRAARELREVQECNANLILSAMRVRERWVALVAGLVPSTYGAEGRQHLKPGRGIVSRSA